MSNKKIHDPISPSGFDGFYKDEGVNLRHYWRVILRYKWGILGLMFSVGLFATIWAYSLQPVYRSSTTILIGNSDNVAASSLDESSNYADKGNFLGTQYELLKSREVARAVLEELTPSRESILKRIEQDAHSGFNWKDWVPQSWMEKLPPALQEQLQINQIPVAESDPDKVFLGWLRDNLRVQPVRNTSLVKLSFESADPKLAARVANTFTGAYIDSNRQKRLESTSETSQWLQEQLEKSQQLVLQSVEELQKYRAKAGLVAVEGIHSIHAEQLKDRSSELSTAHRIRSEKESIYYRAKRLSDSGSGQMDALPSVMDNPRIQRLRDEEQALERRIRSDDERYQGNYPGRDDSMSNLEAVRIQINSALESVIDGFRTEYELAVANERRLQREVAALEGNVQELSYKELEAQALEQAVQTNRQSHEAFLRQLMESSTRNADTVSTIARVVDAAVPEYTAVKPDKRRIVLVSLALSLISGLTIALMLDKLDNTLKSREDVEEHLGIPVLGELVLLKGKRADGATYVPAMEFLDEPTSNFAEDIRTIRTAVSLSSLDQAKQTLVITSTVSSEGKSTVALNLAMSLGQLGKVLLIDADLRRPALAKLYGLYPQTPGLTDLVTGKTGLGNQVIDVPGDIHVLLAGSTIPPDPLKILSSERFSTVLKEAKSIYDTIVIDSPPVELVSDARVLATRADGIVYVIKANETPHQAVRQGLSVLSDSGTPLYGAVLNQINPKEAAAYGKYKYGYSRYGNYGPYSYSHDPKT